jgi:hypothetical protein
LTYQNLYLETSLFGTIGELMPAKAVGNCSYNCAKQLVKNSKFLWAVDRYIADAKKEGHKDCVKMWEHLKKGELHHAQMIRTAIEKKAKKGKFK